MDWIPRVAIVSAATAPAGRAPRTFRDETRKSRLFCHRLSESFLAREGERESGKDGKNKIGFHSEERTHSFAYKCGVGPSRAFACRPYELIFHVVRVSEER